MNFKEI